MHTPVWVGIIPPVKTWTEQKAEGKLKHNILSSLTLKLGLKSSAPLVLRCSHLTWINTTSPPLCCRSVAKSCPILWDFVNCSMPGFRFSHIHPWNELTRLVFLNLHLIDSQFVRNLSFHNCKSQFLSANLLLVLFL